MRSNSNYLLIKMKNYPLTDSEFMDIDDELYSMINLILFPKNEHTMNEEPKLFDWYCEIRNNLCQQIHNKKVIIKE